MLWASNNQVLDGGEAVQESRPARLGFPGEQCSGSCLPAASQHPRYSHDFLGCGCARVRSRDYEGAMEMLWLRWPEGRKAKGRRKHIQSPGSGAWGSSEGLSYRGGFDLPFFALFFMYVWSPGACRVLVWTGERCSYLHASNPNPAAPVCKQIPCS